MPRKTVRAILSPTASQRAALDRTMEAFIAATEHAYSVGRGNDTTGNAVIHRLCYHDIRASYDLSANLTVRAIARASRLLKEGALPAQSSREIEYDTRVFSISPERNTASLSTVCGRLKSVPFHCDPFRMRMLRTGRPVHALLSRNRSTRYDFAITVELSR